MFSTLGGTLTVIAVLLCLLGMQTATLFWLVARVRRLSKLASLATRREKAPQMWESRLLELAAEVSSLSLTFEKVNRQMLRLNSRAGMRELRSEPPGPPPPGASKAEIRKYYGLTREGPDFAKRQLELVRSNDT